MFGVRGVIEIRSGREDKAAGTLVRDEPNILLLGELRCGFPRARYNISHGYDSCTIAHAHSALQIVSPDGHVILTREKF